MSRAHPICRPRGLRGAEVVSTFACTALVSQCHNSNTLPCLFSTMELHGGNLERPCRSKRLTHRLTSATALVVGGGGESCINGPLLRRQDKQATRLSGIAGRTTGTTGTTGGALGNARAGASRKGPKAL